MQLVINNCSYNNQITSTHLTFAAALLVGVVGSNKPVCSWLEECTENQIVQKCFAVAVDACNTHTEWELF